MMGGLRNWLFLDEHAEEVRQRVSHWEHLDIKATPTVTSNAGEFEELLAMIDELHETEEEMRFALR